MGILWGVRLLILIVIYLSVFKYPVEVLVGNLYSNMYIAFTALLAIVTSLKYDVIKQIIEKKKKNKYIYAVIFIVGVFLIFNIIYYIIPLDDSIEDWELVALDENENRELDFIFLPRFHNDAIKIFNMTSLEMIFSICFVILAKIREKMQIKLDNNKNIKIFGKVGYILEKIEKIIYRYNLLIIFYIYILTISSKYLNVYYLKIIGMAIIFLAIVAFIIKNYLSMRKCEENNKKKYGKENLIVMFTPNNYKFTFSGDIRNPLHRFYKYDTKSIGKNLLIDGKDYVFVSYDAIRYKLINYSKYKNIAYVILLKVNFEIFIQDNIIKDIEKKIEEIEKEGNKFIIFSNLETYFNTLYIDEFRKKYKFRCKNKFDVKSVLDVVSLKEDDEFIKEKAVNELSYVKEKELDNYIEKNKKIKPGSPEFEKAKEKLLEKIGSESIKEKDIQDSKNIYIKYCLNNIINSFNYTEYFYSLLKMCEYMMHYMALKNIIDNPKEILKNKIRIQDGTLGVWKQCINKNKEYDENVKEDKDIINALRKIIKVLDIEINEKNHKITFKEDICGTIVDIRNKLLGHGVITYDISEQIVKNLFIITSELLKEFEDIKVTIKEDEKIKDIFYNDFQATYKDNKAIFLYDMANIQKKEDKEENKEDKKNNKYEISPEYLNYETGKRKVLNKKIERNIDMVWTSKEIEKNLAKWVIK